MFGSMKKRIDNPAGDIETIIGRGTKITGKITGSGNIRIDGHLDGDVVTTGDIVVGESGVVQGEIRAGNLTVAGIATGNVTCDGNLSIQSSGQLIGDVRVRSLIVSDGGIFKGRSEMETKNDISSALFAPAN